jgi:outer membrane protein assembly factor BamB
MNFSGGPGRIEVSWRLEPAVFAAIQLSHNLTNSTKIPVPVCATPIVAKDFGVVIAGYDGYITLYDHALSQEKWRVRLGGGIYASPVVGPEPDTMVVATVNGSVALIDLHGRKRWVAQVESPVYSSPVVIKEDRIAVATFNHILSILDVANGEVIESIKLPKPWYSLHGGLASSRTPYATPVISSKNNLIVATGDYLVCVNIDLRVLWTVSVGADIRSSPVASYETGLVGVCGVDGVFSFFHETDGRLVRQTQLGAKVTSSPALHENIVVVGTPKKTFAISVEKAEILWTYDDAARDYTSYTLSPNGDVIFTGISGNAISLDVINGIFNWETSQLLGWDRHDSQLNTTPVVAENGTMYATSYAGYVYYFGFSRTCIPDSKNKATE